LHLHGGYKEILVNIQVYDAVAIEHGVGEDHMVALLCKAGGVGQTWNALLVGVELTKASFDENSSQSYADDPL